MIKDLIHLANKLDSLGLTKEANILDGIIKQAAEMADGDIQSLDFNSLKKLIIELSIDELKEMFTASCNETIANAKRVFGEDVDQHIDLLTPKYSGVLMEGLVKIYGDEKVEEFSMTPQDINPEMFISVVNSIIDDTSGRYFSSVKAKAKSLARSFDNIASRIFKSTI